MEKHKGNADGTEHQKQQALNVARTNDESVVSKRSAARAGYFDDRFLAHFVRKPSKRAALINRGYYIRREAVMLAVRHFLARHGRECQIVSLGAGFDTLFFVLAAQDQHPRRFFEMDFDHVVKNKRTLIEGTEELMALVGADAVINGDTHEIESPRYALLCGDLCQAGSVKTRLTQRGLSYSLPTLFLAECVFTYMPNEDSDRLIFWAASAPFPECCFVTYEQVRPYDAFGRTMRDNLKARGSDLLGIEGYPTVEAQCERYAKLGFKSVGVQTMLQVYWDHLSAQERARVETMEEFDEHEEWLEKCSHYILAVSSTSAAQALPFGTCNKPSEPVYPACEVEWKDALVKTSGRSVELKRWGHSACVTGDDRIVIFGGYGGGARHERLSSVAVMYKDAITLPSVSGVAPSARVLHGACMLAGERMLVHGGRSGPGTPLSDAFVLECGSMQWKKLDVGMPACYRHSLTVVGEDAKRAIGFGGRLGWKQGEVSGNVWLVSPDERIWRMIAFVGDARPPPRSSHAACWHRGALYIHGGLGSDYRVLSDVWRLEFDGDFGSCRAELVVQTDVARFSHSVVAADEQTLLLLGGHNHTLQNTVVIFDSAKGTVRGVVPTPEGWSRSRSVAVDNRIVSVGGGMICFSFGSAFCGDDVVVRTFPRRLTPKPVSVAIAPIAAAVASIPKPIAGNRVIQRLHNVTVAQFRDVLSRLREPVLFSGSDVPRWTKADILAAVPPETLASVHVCESPLLDFANKNFRFEVVPFADMLTRIEDPSAHLYFRSLGANARKDPSHVPETFPQLAKQFMVPDFARDIVLPESMHSSCLRFSSQDVQMWTHYDINDNLLCGIRGRKRLILFHPEEIRHLYPEGTASAVLDVETPDLARFPRFAKAVKWEGILEEGDVLFISAMWWHNVRTLTPCYGLNVFFRHLPEASYQSNDLYGNKDPLLAVAAEKALKQAVASLSNLPDEYKRFFARKAIMEMKSDLL